MQVDVQNGVPRATILITNNNPMDFTLQLDHLKLNTGIPYFATLHVDPYVSSFSLDFSDHASKIRSYNPAQLVDPSAITAGSFDGIGGFAGCMRILRFNEENMNLVVVDQMASENNMITENLNGIPYGDSRDVVSGCSHVATCANMDPNFCPNGMICKDLWKGPVCGCPEGGTALLDAEGRLSHCNEIAAVSSLGISSPAVILIIVCLAVLICKFPLSNFPTTFSLSACLDDGCLYASKAGSIWTGWTRRV